MREESKPCPLCSSLVATGGIGSHLRKCKFFHCGESREQRRATYLAQLFPKVTEIWLRQAYIQEQKSLPEIQAEMGINFSATLFLLEFWGIPKRGHQEANSSSLRQQKSQKTWLEKFGVLNPSQAPEIKAKKAETFQKNHGASNIFKTEGFNLWAKGRMLEIYGKRSLPNRFGGMTDWWRNKPLEFRQKHLLKARNQYLANLSNISEEERTRRIQLRCNGVRFFKPSKLEAQIKTLLERLQIPFTQQFWVDRRSFDFRICDSNILLEINGDYIHANPRRYKAEDSLPTWTGERLARDIWERDLQKRLIAEKYGYQVVYIWELEIKQSLDVIAQRLKEIRPTQIEKKVHQHDYKAI